MAPISWCEAMIPPDWTRVLAWSLARRSGDHQPLLHEPVARVIVSRPDLAEHLLGPDPHAVEHELRVLEHERVHVRRGPLHADPRRILVDEEQRRRPLVAGERLHDEKVGDVPHGHEPLLAADPPPVAVGLGDSLNQRGVGPRLLLGHGEAVAPLAVDGRDEVALALFGSAVAQRVGRAPDGVPQGVGQLTEALLDDDLV
jgi:hypothetical protein